MTASTRSKTVAVVVKLGFIDGFQYQAETFLDDFISWGGHTQGAFAFLFGNVDSSDRVRLVLLLSQQLNRALNFSQAVSGTGVKVAKTRE